MCPPLVNIANLQGQARLPNLRDFLISSIIPASLSCKNQTLNYNQLVVGKAGLPPLVPYVRPYKTICCYFKPLILAGLTKSVSASGRLYSIDS